MIIRNQRVLEKSGALFKLLKTIYRKTDILKTDGR